MSEREGKRVGLRRTTIRDEIADELKMRILAGEWALGEALPSNRQLAEEFQTSPLTVREAVAQLNARGFLDSRHGSGTFVVSNVPEDSAGSWIMARGDLSEYAELIEARQLIEFAILRLAVERRTEDQISELYRCIGTMVDSRSAPEEFISADFIFHQLVAEAAHNRILLRAMTAMRGPLRRLMAERAIREVNDHGNLDVAIADHKDLVEALEYRDVERATAALNGMISRNLQHLRSLTD
jgi:DNA-binding FadR family transcriptional regulator